MTQKNKKGLSKIWIAVIGGLVAIVAGSGCLLSALGFSGVGIWFYTKFQGAMSGFSSGGTAMVIPAEYAAVFNAASNPNNPPKQTWKIRPEFLAAIFYAGEHQNSWPPNINGPWQTSKKDAYGPFQFILSTWNGHKQYARPNPKNATGEPDIQDIWDSAFAAAHMLGALGAKNNTTDLNKLRDVASAYNSGLDWNAAQNSPKQEVQKQTIPYVNRVIDAFSAFMASGSDIVTVARKYLDKPYKVGGTGPDNFDCSGLVTAALQDAGYLPKNVRIHTSDIAKYTQYFQKVNDLQPGDIMLFKGHMVIYMGRTGTGGAEQIIESSISGNVHISNKSAWVDKNMNIWLGNYRPIKK